jgi:hypothetical protein
MMSPLGKPLGHIRTYIGPLAVKNFLLALMKDVKFLHKLIKEKRDYLPQVQDKDLFKKATHCHICLRPFEKNDEKMLDHDHITGQYRGAAHRVCNSKYTTGKKRYLVPIVFHNLRGYDSYLIIRGVKDVLEHEVEDRAHCEEYG